MERDVWVDFNDLDESGYVTTLAEHARPGLDLRVGNLVRVGDDEGSVAMATIVKPRTRRSLRNWRRPRILALQIDHDSFRSEDPPPEATSAEPDVSQQPR